MQQLGYAHQEPWEEVPPGERVCMRALKLLRASFLPVPSFSQPVGGMNHTTFIELPPRRNH